MARNSDITQQWEDPEFCQRYAEARNISIENVHYGWLADGEDVLQLFAGVPLEGANVLDMGCGMGENLIALHRKGAKCFGIDVSPHMLAFAQEKIGNRPQPPIDIQLERQDMRELSAFPKVVFDVVLSVYSLEYLRSIQELRALATNLFARIRPGGYFIFCFSHPLQHHRHSQLGNTSSAEGDSETNPFIYSFRDVVAALADAGFSIERIVEQGTKNPSQITFEIGKQFPYNFAEGKNPCRSEFDTLSNQAPHTIIYKCKTPSKVDLRDRTRYLRFGTDKVTIWGQQRTIVNQATININGRYFDICNLARKDAIMGLCPIANFTIESKDLRDLGKMKLSTYRNGIRSGLEINSSGLLALTAKHLSSLGLTAICQTQTVLSGGDSSDSQATYIQRIDPLFGELNSLFPRQNLGILVFQNGIEPSNGKVGIDKIVPSIGDRIEVIYVMSDWGSEWAHKGPNMQLDLF